jgi:hypothetical protein
VTVALSTLLGLDEQPGELDGYGPITAAHARRLAADPSGTWYRLITDDAGRLLDYAQTRYRPPQALIDHVAARDQRCRFPHCTRPARRCELDHVTPFGPNESDGSTAVDNLAALCPRHHHLKHESGWRLTGDPAGTLTWTSPLGHSYLSEPEALPTTTELTNRHDDSDTHDDDPDDDGTYDDGTYDADTYDAAGTSKAFDAHFAITAADRAEADAWLDQLLRDELVACVPPPTDWLADNLPAIGAATPDVDEPPPF